MRRLIREILNQGWLASLIMFGTGLALWIAAATASRPDWAPEWSGWLVTTFGWLLMAVGFAGLAASLLANRENQAPSPDCFGGAIMSELDPYSDFGVSPSAIADRYLASSDVPPYVRRDIDSSLDAAALTSPFVLVIGDSKAGKSRAAYQSLTTQFDGHSAIIVRVSSAASTMLQNLARGICRAPATPTPTIVYIDDIDEYLLHDEVAPQALQSIIQMWPTYLVVGTIRSSEYLKLTQGADDRAATFREAARLLSRARRVVVPTSWEGRDAGAALGTYRNERFDARLGLPAHLIGATQLAERLALGATENPAGLAIALAACDARRAGLSRGLSLFELTELWATYLPTGPGAPQRTESTFLSALDWACQRTDARLSLVYPTDHGYRAFDYAVALRAGTRPGGLVGDIPASTWAKVRDIASAEEAYGVAAAAYFSNQPKVAESALRKATRSTDPRLQAVASVKLAEVTHSPDRDAGEITSLLDEIATRFAQTSDPVIQEQVATALFDKAVIVGETDRASAIAIYDDVVTRFGESDDPGLQAPLAKALFNKAVAVGETDRASAIAIYDDVVRRFAQAGDPEVRETVGRALVNKALIVAESDPAAAIAIDDDVVRRFGDSEDPTLQELVARALSDKGVVVRRTDPVAEIAIFDDVVGRFDGSNDPALEKHVARALVNKAVVVGTSDPAAAIAIYDDVLTRFGDSDNPALQELVAKALFNSAGSVNDVADKVRIYDDVATRFGQTSDPDVREVVARALVKKAVIVSASDPAAAISIYDDIIGRFGDSDSPALQQHLAKTLLNEARIISASDPAAAISIYDDIITRFGDSDNDEVRQAVALSLFNKAIGIKDRAVQLATYDELLSRFGESNDRELQVPVARALFNKAVILDESDVADELRIYEEVVSRFAESNDPAVQVVVAAALLNKAGKVGESDSAAETGIYDDLISRFDETTDPEVRELVEKAKTCRNTSGSA